MSDCRGHLVVSVIKCCLQHILSQQLGFFKHGVIPLFSCHVAATSWWGSSQLTSSPWTGGGWSPHPTPSTRLVRRASTRQGEPDFNVELNFLKQQVQFEVIRIEILFSSSGTRVYMHGSKWNNRSYINVHLGHGKILFRYYLYSCPGIKLPVHGFPSVGMRNNLSLKLISCHVSQLLI
jgi:hypothetical protein